MSRFQINKAWASAGFLCLIGCTLMLTLSLTVIPKDWANAGLGGAVALGLLSAGWSAAAVTPNSSAP